jgi:pantoate--beta-alanine ligase
MKIVRTVRDLRRWVERSRGKSVGFVPTMGDLHEGHLSLLRRSRRENRLTVLSLFVNPKQFDRREDYERYHRGEKADLRKARAAGADLAFLPSEKELYPEGFQSWVTVEELQKPLCGAFRPGHFRGVATVVLKLLNLVQPRRAYFGTKDYQQYRLIGRMVKDLDLPVEIAGCPIVREPDGLAMSSRNRRLSPSERVRAADLYSALEEAAALLRSRRAPSPKEMARAFRSRLRLAKGDRVEYFECVDPESLSAPKALRPPLVLAAAVWIGGTRLIDNLEVS